MPYSLSVWLDDDTAEDLKVLADREERRRSEMLKVLIRRAARDLARGDKKQVTRGKGGNDDRD